MKTQLKVAALVVCSALVGLPTSQAADPWSVPSDWKYSDVYVQFGNGEDALVVEPKKLTLQAGVPYRIVFVNPSEQTHILSAPDLAGRVLTTDVRRYPVDEVLPSPTGGELLAFLRPAEQIEWYLMPTTEGTFKIGCALSDHAKAGMDVAIEVMPRPAWT